MDEAEVDDWFEQQKLVIDEAYQNDMESHLNDPKATKEQYDKSYKKLISDYQKKLLNLYESEQTHTKLQAPVDRMKEAYENTNRRIARFYKKKKLAIQKWVFDVKFRLTFLR